ncbi:MAG: AAA family ATPase [Pseudomonadota bacterium]
MNDPLNIVIDPEEMRLWLFGHKTANALSWRTLGLRSGLALSTAQAFCSGTYKGNIENVAREVYAFKQKVESQEARAATALARPDFIETKTAQRLQFLMEWAQGGRMTAAALGPGTGKTVTAEHYKASIGDTVWIATMKESTRSPTAMIAQVMKAMGLVDTRGWAQQRSGQIEEYVRGKQGLLIVDEANHLELPSLEEIRAWHDSTGLGVIFLANEELLERIRGGSRRHAYARLNSRIAHFHVQDLPLEEDVAAYLDAMEIDDPAMCRPLTEVALSPGHGGLRELQQILESAHMAAIATEKVLELDHIKQAIASRTIDARRRGAK